MVFENDRLGQILWHKPLNARCTIRVLMAAVSVLLASSTRAKPTAMVDARSTAITSLLGHFRAHMNASRKAYSGSFWKGFHTSFLVSSAFVLRLSAFVNRFVMLKCSYSALLKYLIFTVERFQDITHTNRVSLC